MPQKRRSDKLATRGGIRRCRALRFCLLSDGNGSNVRVVALSNSEAGQVSMLLERMGLDGHVERVFSADDVKRWKPYQQVAQALFTPPVPLGTAP